MAVSVVSQWSSALWNELFSTLVGVPDLRDLGRPEKEKGEVMVKILGGLCMHAANIKCIAFDCFGTVFDMSGVSREEIKAYVDHVRKEDFTPFAFPQSWWNLKAHPDSAEGIASLQRDKFFCVALSNGDVDLIDDIAIKNGIFFDHIVDLAGRHKVYKPHVAAYRTIGKDTCFKPFETLMVTANPTFGDIEGSAAIGMPSQVIRHGHPNDIVELAELLKQLRGAE